MEFSESLIGAHMDKTTFKVMNVVQLGQTLLDLSKLVMYEFHYDYRAPKYGEKLKTRFMGIDRFSTISRCMTFMKTSLRM